jgi:hypothetical protein
VTVTVEAPEWPEYVPVIVEVPASPASPRPPLVMATTDASEVPQAAEAVTFTVDPSE